MNFRKRLILFLYLEQKKTYTNYTINKLFYCFLTLNDFGPILRYTGTNCFLSPIFLVVGVVTGDICGNCFNLSIYYNIKIYLYTFIY